MGQFRAQRQTGCLGGPDLLRRFSIARNAAPNPAPRWVSCSSPISRAIRSHPVQEGLNQYRDLLEKGASVLLSLQANVDGEDVRARIMSVEPLDTAASRVQKGLRVFLRDSEPLGSIASRLASKGDGEISLVLLTGSGRSRSAPARQISGQPADCRGLEINSGHRLG